MNAVASLKWETDRGGGIMEQLFDSSSDSWLPAVIQIKNLVIGNNKMKASVMMLGVVPRLLQFMIDETTSLKLRIESAIVLGSLAKGGNDSVRTLVEAGTLSVLLKDIFHPDVAYVEACLRCLRTMVMSDLVPTHPIFEDAAIVPHMISIMAKSTTTQECVATILGCSCKTTEHQEILCGSGAVAALAPLLLSDIYKVQMPCLRCLCAMCHNNTQVSLTLGTATYNDDLIPSLLARLLSREKSTDMQMMAAKCVTYMCRAEALHPRDTIVAHKALSTLVRMCKCEAPWEARVVAAETLAGLLEVDLELQRTAAISDHLMAALADYFRYPGCPPDMSLMPTKKDDIVVGNELRQAAFRAYASLGANDEDIRKRIIETENLMDHVVNGLSDPVTKVQLAAVRCLHSLSRSVQQLRTSFQDHSVWKPLMKILQSSTDEVLTVASSSLCNLLLEFSPSKEAIVESGAIDLLVSLTKRDDPALRLNAIWALMNMAFQSDQKTKSRIVSTLGTDQLFQLLQDPDTNVLMKTLGLLRNLLSNKPHIDHIMLIHGNQIMQAVIMILEGEHPTEVKEQALCIVANVADGDSAKAFLMSNEDILRKLMNYMVHANVKLQIAATFCVSNLIWNEEDGALERQSQLQALGVQKLLQQLLSTKDATLFETVKTALQQF